MAPLWGIKEYIKVIERYTEPSHALKADCAVVLTGGAGRVREGIALLSRQQIKQLIITGVHQSTTMSEIMPEIIYYPEIDLEKVILERRSISTEGNALQSLVLVEALNCSDVLLVTSDYHMNRALKTYESVFPPNIQITPYVVSSDKTIGRKIWLHAFEEFYKYLFYDIFVF